MGRLIIVIVFALEGLFTGMVLAADPPSVPAVRYAPKPAEVAGITTPVLSLNGTWSFHPAPPRGFEKLTEKNAKGWTPIEVPGDWSMQGQTVKPWTAAGYLKTVTVPADWKGARIILRSDGAQSLATFWVNGKPAGTYEGGFTAFEFDVTDLCRPGAANTIAAAVQNESTADILASGTQYASYQFGGLTRKVTLFAVPAPHIAGFEIATDVAEDGRSAAVRIEADLANTGRDRRSDISLDIALSDPAGRSVLRRTLQS
ncbi:MAG: glycoside hydrolase family 2, partial [Candidatus Aminicenantes bacterium]|nr:glycoside hydrolase family 2 [Candidatus Aminicenantes bacterium]